MQHDRSRREAEDHADCERCLPREAEKIDAEQHDGRRRQADLQPAETDELGPHLPQRARAELEPDEEQHKHDAELREMLEVLGVDDEAEHRSDDHACEEVAEDRAHAEPHCDRHRDDGGQ